MKAVITIFVLAAFFYLYAPQDDEAVPIITAKEFTELAEKCEG